MADSMQPDDIHCLTEDVIRKFLAGELDDAQDQIVSDHLEDCAACQRLTMTFLTVDDLCLPWVKASGRDTVELARQTAETVTSVSLKQIAGLADRPSRSHTAVSLSRPSRGRAAEPVPDRVDRYEIVAAIGQGGMGSVYLALDHELERECAVKVLKASRGSRPKAVARSRRELDAIGRLTHPNIVAVLDAGTLDDDRTFLVMEFLRGSDLESYVQAHGPLSPEEVCGMVIQAARGLQHAHTHGFVHRDVKPSNLFRTDDGTVKLLDFGLVQLRPGPDRELNPLTELGQMLGTADFMSPEQATDARSTDPRSDIYSLGCTLAWLLSGQTVFPSRSVSKVLFAHRNTPPPGLAQLRPDVPAGLDPVFQKMVAKCPEDRFQSMAQVIDALLPFASAEFARGFEGSVSFEEGVSTESRGSRGSSGSSDSACPAPETAETAASVPDAPSAMRKTSRPAWTWAFRLGLAAGLGIAAVVLIRAATDRSLTDRSPAIFPDNSTATVSDADAVATPDRLATVVAPGGTPAASPGPAARTGHDPGDPGRKVLISVE